MKKNLLILFLFTTIITNAQTKSLLLMNGIAHLGTDSIIQNSVIGIKNGKIVLVADAGTVKLDKLLKLRPNIIMPDFIKLCS